MIKMNFLLKEPTFYVSFTYEQNEIDPKVLEVFDNLEEFSDFVRTKSPYKVKLLATFGPAIELKGENLK